jgi:hypothetical protein
MRSLLVEQLAGNPALIAALFVDWMKARLQFQHLLQARAARLTGDKQIVYAGGE